jgi:predicted dehydrogenase
MTVGRGVTGAGGIARRRTIPEGIAQAAGARLAAVYDVDRQANREVAGQFGAAACASEEELLARKDVDAVYIATPVHLHARQATAAAQAGKHILCEKPLGLSVAEAEAVPAACRKAGVLLAVDFMMRFHAFHREARRLIEQGALGRMVLARAQLSCWYPPITGAWRQDPATGGGGSLIDMGGHCIDLLEMFLGRARSVSCRTGNLVHPYTSEDTAVVLLEFESGALGTADACFNIPDRASRNRLELYGSRGSILAEGTIGQGEAGEMVLRIEDAAGYHARQARDLAGGVRVDEPTVNLYRAQVEDVNAAIATGREPLCSGQAGGWSQKVLAACYESARTGRTVGLGPAAVG